MSSTNHANSLDDTASAGIIPRADHDFGSLHTDSIGQERSNGNDQIQPPKSLFTPFLTAVNFVTFLFSLVAVEVHYTIRRASLQVKAQSPTLRRLLHPLENAYYHSHQKKLLRMEVEQAFQLWNKILAVVLVLAVLTFSGIWHFAGHIFPRWLLARAQ